MKANEIPRVKPDTLFLNGTGKGRKLKRLLVELSVDLNAAHDETEVTEIMRRAVRGAFPNNRKFIVMSAIADEPSNENECDWTNLVETKQ